MMATTSRWKRTIAAFLVVLICISAMPVAAFAAENDTVITVSNSKGQPINGATVTFFDEADATLASANSGEDGKAYFDSSLIDAASRYTAAASGYQTVEQSIGSVPSAVQLTPVTVTVSGVVSGDGMPVEGAAITLSGYGEYTATTDENGGFSIVDVYNLGEYSFAVSKDGFKPLKIEGINDFGTLSAITLELKEELALSFEQNSISLPMGTSVRNPPVDDGGRQIEYSSNDENVVKVDADGNLNPTGVGNAVITAKCQENDQYKASEASYSVTVTKGTQTVSFQNGATPTVPWMDVRRAQSYSNPVVGTGTAVYSLVSGGELVSEFNTSTGAFKFFGTGEIKVSVSLSDPNYETATGTYTLTVAEGFDASVAYDIRSENSMVNSWYSSDVYLEPVAPGYSFRYKDEALNVALGLADGQWSEKLLLTNISNASSTPDGILSDIGIYVQRISDVAMVGEITLAEIKKDSVAPEATLTVEEKSVWDKFLYIISFGNRGGNTNAAIMTITAKDDHSNVNEIYYHFAEGMEPLTYEQLSALDESAWTKYTATIPVNPGELTSDGEEVDTTKDAFFTAYARVSDIAGNICYVNSSGVILDTTKPNASVMLDDGSELGAELDGNTIYNSDFTLKVHANDGDKKAGIKSIDYWFSSSQITLSGEASSEDLAKNLYTATTAEDGGVLPVDLVDSWSDTINVDASVYNCSDLKLHVKVTDRADNSNITVVSLNVDKTAPVITLDYGTTAATSVYNGMSYFANSREVTVTIKERSNHFDTDAASAGITIAAKNAAGQDVNVSYSISEWSHTTAPAGESPDEDTHTAVISFTGDAIYSLEVGYTDKAGNVGVVSKTGAVTDKDFVVDKSIPGGSIDAGGSAWENLLDTITFGRWYAEGIDIKGSFRDDVSPVKSFEYLISDTATALTEEQLNAASWIAADISAVSAGSKFNVAKAEPDSRLVVYARITDAANNCVIISSDGMILDATKSQLKITVSDANENGYYSGDVTVTVEANEIISEGQAYSGIKSVDYEITGGGQMETDNLFTFSGTNPKYDELETVVTETFAVDATRFNADNVKVTVTVTDNAGNTVSDSVTLNLDKTAPDITLDYGTTAATSVYNGMNYFAESREVTLTIMERSSGFDAAAASAGITITAKDAKGQDVGGSFTVSDWTSTPGESPDEDAHTAVISFTGDAIYSLEFGYTDKAGNVGVVSKAGAVTDKDFVVDKTNPSGSIAVGSSTWDSLLKALTFGLWYNEGVDVKGSFQDDVSPIKTFEYLVSDSSTALTEDQLSVANWQTADISSVSAGSLFNVAKAEPDSRLVVYARITDAANNCVIISSDGMVLDAKVSELVVSVPAANANGFYNDDVTVTVKANELISGGQAYSGIKSVDYEITGVGQMETDNLYTFSIANPSYDDLETVVTETFVVDATKFNADNVKVTVTVTDNAGNTVSDSVFLNINSTAPEIEISFDDNEADSGSSYQNQRIATVEINDRASSFDADAVIFDIKALDAGNAAVTEAYEVSNWTSVGDKHTATITFSEANFSFAMEYTNKADKTANISYADGTKDYNKFTVDLTDPAAKLSIKETGNLWDKLVEILSFGLFSNKSLTVQAEYSDSTSEVVALEYYKSNSEFVENVNDISTWTDVDLSVATANPLDLCTVDPDERFAIYMRVTDNSGRKTIISTDAGIVDATAPETQLAAETLPNFPEDDKTYYNKEITEIILKASVEEPVNVNNAEAPQSGIKSVSWTSTGTGIDGESGTLYSYTAPEGTVAYDDLYMALEAAASTIKLDPEKNNSNEVTVTITAVDNAGNTATANTKLCVDVTAPEIEVSVPTGHLNQNVNAEFVILERNFDEKQVVIEADMDGKPITIEPKWTETPGSTDGNGDDTKYTYSHSLSADGKYTISKVTCTDKAGNVTVYTPDINFTLDKTAPVITVTYNNNNVTNGRYYNADRLATITVVDENFDTESAQALITATLGGNQVAIPTLSAWTSAGNTHKATINFTQEAEYTFRFSCKDKAGNASAVVEPDFCLDKTKPIVELKGIEDQSANNDSGDIGFVLTATDINFDVFQPKVIAVTQKDGKIVKSVYSDGVISEIAGGKVFTVKNLPEDGIYRVTCTVVDKAGNAYDQVIMVDADGTQTAVEKNALDDLLQFSVNRKGSTFELDEKTFDMVDKYYVQYVYHDISIIEVNADTLTDYQVTLNGKELTAGKDFDLVREGGNGEWMRYTYTLNKELFEDEGEYTVVVSSVDKATNNAFSDIKNAAVSFVVDRTAPIVSISGMESDGRYQTEKQTVSLIPTDDGGALASLLVYLVDDEGNTLKELINLSGEELLDALEENSGMLSFEIEEGLYQNVRIICKDLAVDDQGNVNTYDESFTNISVSSSKFMIFWANKPLRNGVLLGVLGLSLIPFFIFLGKRKKEKEATHA